METVLGSNSRPVVLVWRSSAVIGPIGVFRSGAEAGEGTRILVVVSQIGITARGA